MKAVRASGMLVCLGLCIGGTQGGAATPVARQGIRQYSIAQWGHRDGLPSTAIYAMVQTPDGFLWLGTSDGLVRFDGIHFVQIPLSKIGDMAFGQVRALTVDRAGRLWIGTESGSLVRMEGDSMQVVSVGLPIMAVREDAASTIEVATANGMLYFDPTSLRNLTSLRSKARADSLGANPCSTCGPQVVSAALLRRAHLAPKQLRTAMRDREGNLWLGTRESGIVRIAHPNGSAVIDRLTTANGLSSDTVWDILEDREGNLWIATQNGLDRLRKGKFTMLTRSDSLLSNDVAALVVMRDSLFAGSASGLTRTTANQTKIVSRSATLAMAGTVDGALLVAQPQGIGWLQSGYVKPLGIPAEHVTALAQDSGRTLWFYEQQKGLFRWQPGGTVAPVMLPGHGQELVTVIQADTRGATWFGLASGVVVLHRDGNFRSFSTEDGLAGGVPHSISTLPDGEAWIASERGLSLYADHHFTRWTRRNGLPGNRVLWALPGPDGLLWLGYNVGVASVHIEDLRRAASDASFQAPFDFFDEGDGLKSNPDLRSSSPAALTADGRLWLTTVEGVATLDLEHIPRDTVPPPVHILAFRADDVDANPAGGVNLPSHTRRVEINYTGLSLTDPGRVTFQYRLLGFDPHWQDVGGHRFAAYTNLPPGQYRFEVKAANEDGVWSNVPAVLIFSIAPAIYQTAWFMVICVVTILLATAALIRLRVRMAAKTLRLRFEERLEERARVAQDLHDNLLQDVMGISLQLEIADELTPFGAPGKPVLQRALVLSAATLAGGRGVLTTLRTTSLSLQDLMRDVALALEAFPEERQHTVRLIADESALLVRASVGEELVQIAREALRNALQHTAGRVSVRCHSASGHLHLVVEDEGLGIESAILASGVPGHYGLRGMQERADRIAATLRFRSREGGGLRVELDVPADIAFVQEKSAQTLWTRIMARWRRANNTADRLND